MILYAPHLNQKKSATPLAEIGNQQFPLLAIHDQSLTLGDYQQPAQPGDFLRLNLRFNAAMPGRISLLAVVTHLNPATAELQCRIEQADPEGLALLRQLATHSPALPSVETGLSETGAPGPGLRPSARLGGGLRRPSLPAAAAGLVLLALGGGLGLLGLRALASSMATITIENGVIAPPPGPVVAAVEPVVARERGLIDQIYGREGMAVAPGQPLFSTRQDPRIDLDLLDRQASRDLAALEARLRDGERALDGLVGQIALSLQEGEQLPASATADQLRTLRQQIAVARRLEQRRLALLRQGGISQDSYDGALDRLLDLEARQQQLLRQSRADQGKRERVGVLRSLERLQRRRLLTLQAQRQELRASIDQRRALRRQHPLPATLLAEPLQERAIYKASAAGLILRQLKAAGATIHANEAVFLLQKQQLPPVIEAQVKEEDVPALVLGSEGIAEIPALRQQFPIRLVSRAARGQQSRNLRFELLHLQANDQRLLVALQGKSARLFLANQHNWFERLRNWFNQDRR